MYVCVCVRVHAHVFMCVYVCVCMCTCVCKVPPMFHVMPLLPLSISKLAVFVTHFLLHTGGVKAVLSRLCVGVDTINDLTSLDYS